LPSKTPGPQYTPSGAPFAANDAFITSTTYIAVQQSTPHVDSASKAAIEDTIATIFGVYEDPGAIVKVDSYSVTNVTSLPLQTEIIISNHNLLPPPNNASRQLTTSTAYSASFVVLVIILKSSAAANGTTPEKLAQSQEELMTKAFKSGNLTVSIRKFALLLGSTALQNTTVQSVQLIKASATPTRFPINSPLNYSTDSANKKLSNGAIAGIVIGGVACLLLVLVFIYRRMIFEAAAADIAHPKYAEHETPEFEYPTNASVVFF